MDFHPQHRAACNAVKDGLGDLLHRCFHRASEIAHAGTKTEHSTLEPLNALWAAILQSPSDKLQAALQSWLNQHTLPSIPDSVKVDTRDFFAAKDALVNLGVPFGK
jgi:hypothetical protein